MSGPEITFPHELIDLLRAACRVTVLTGAGISAESGIPTFRDAMTGLWARFRPEDLATPQAFERDPRLVWEWYSWRRGLVGKAKPNAAHLAVARLECLVREVVVVTQNVDGLHHRAGSSRVIELHGNIMRSCCSREGTVAATWEKPEEGPPQCERCGAYLRPDVVWFGEPLPQAALQEAYDTLSASDLVLSVGTSNVVEPAASMPWAAAAAGVPVAVVNLTMSGQRAGPGIFHLEGRAGAVLPGLLAAAWPEAAP